MPRLVFENEENFLDWARNRTSAEKHTLYVSKNIMVLVPNVSTPPVEYAVLTKVSEEAEERLQDLGFVIFEVERVQWKVDRPVKKRSFL